MDVYLQGQVRPRLPETTEEEEAKISWNCQGPGMEAGGGLSVTWAYR